MAQSDGQHGELDILLPGMLRHVLMRGKETPCMCHAAMLKRDALLPKDVRNLHMHDRLAGPMACARAPHMHAIENTATALSRMSSCVW